MKHRKWSTRRIHMHRKCKTWFSNLPVLYAQLLRSIFWRGIKFNFSFAWQSLPGSRITPVGSPGEPRFALFCFVLLRLSPRTILFSNQAADQETDNYSKHVYVRGTVAGHRGSRNVSPTCMSACLLVVEKRVTQVGARLATTSFRFAFVQSRGRSLPQDYIENRFNSEHCPTVFSIFELLDSPLPIVNDLRDLGITTWLLLMTFQMTLVTREPHRTS